MTRIQKLSSAAAQVLPVPSLCWHNYYGVPDGGEGKGLQNARIYLRMQEAGKAATARTRNNRTR